MCGRRIHLDQTATGMPNEMVIYTAQHFCDTYDSACGRVNQQQQALVAEFGVSGILTPDQDVGPWNVAGGCDLPESVRRVIVSQSD